MSITVAIAGASGYAGGEILRLLLAHPAYRSGELRIGALTGGSNAGTPMAELMPHLPELGDRVLEETNADTLAGADVVFLGLPHGHSAAIAQQLPDDTIIIDAGADFRLKSAADWESFYGTEHQGTWTYGLPEIPGQRELIASSTRIAVPGCFPTGATLALLPAVAAGLTDNDISVTSISGTSGAGKKPAVALLGSEVMGNIRAYNTAGRHRHTPEITQNLQPFVDDDADLNVAFTPVLAPLPRGILTTANAKIAADKLGSLTTEQAQQIYREFYANASFVHLMPGTAQPETKSVVGSNMTHLQVEVDARSGRLIITGAIDNLTKGTGGGAVQCMNIICKFDETAGLPCTGLAP